MGLPAYSSPPFLALKTFEERVQITFPEASFSLTDPFGGDEIGIELILPVTSITREERMKIAELAAEIEEEFEVIYRHGG
jgi:hypothetical protein